MVADLERLVVIGNQSRRIDDAPGEGFFRRLQSFGDQTATSRCF